MKNKAISRKTYYSSILSITAGVFISSHSSISFADTLVSPSASCETVEASRTYMSGVCPADHSSSKGDQKLQLSYRCEMMANDDFIVSEVSKVTTCEANTLTTATAPALNTSRALAGTVTN